MKLLLLCFIQSCLLTISGQATHYEIYLLTGQSNSLGCTAYAKKKKKSFPPKSYRDKKISFFWSNRSTRGGDGDAALIGNSGGKITTLQAQQGEGKNLQFWGPEIGFARALHKAGKKNFIIIKASRGGGGNSYWSKGKQMYQHVLETTKQCEAILTKRGDTFSYAGLLYLQGESNNAAEAKNAGNHFLELWQNLQQDLTNAKKMKAYIGGIAAGRQHKITSAQQEALAEKNNMVHFFSNTDLKKHLYDGLHFDQSAKLKIGKRFAQLVLKGAEK